MLYCNKNQKLKAPTERMILNYMDVFFEQIIKRKRRGAEAVVRIMFIIITILVILLMLYVAIFHLFGAFSGLFLLGAFGIAIAAYFYLLSLNIEYEYSLTNGFLDIDKISGKRKRRRMLSTSCKEFEEFGSYDVDKQRLAQRAFDFKVLPANLRDTGLYYAVIRKDGYGTGLLVFQPNEKILSGLKKFIPRSVQKDVLSGY